MYCHICPEYVEPAFCVCGFIVQKIVGLQPREKIPEFSYVPHKLLCMGLWSRFLTFVEM